MHAKGNSQVSKGTLLKQRKKALVISSHEFRDQLSKSPVKNTELGSPAQAAPGSTCSCLLLSNSLNMTKEHRTNQGWNPKLAAGIAQW